MKYTEKELSAAVLRMYRMYNAYQRELKDSGCSYKYIEKSTYERCIDNLTSQQKERLAAGIMIVDSFLQHCKKQQYKKQQW